jgi:hypothetical protein
MSQSEPITGMSVQETWFRGNNQRPLVGQRAFLVDAHAEGTDIAGMPEARQNRAVSQLRLQDDVLQRREHERRDGDAAQRGHQPDRADRRTC